MRGTWMLAWALCLVGTRAGYAQPAWAPDALVVIAGRLVAFKGKDYATYELWTDADGVHGRLSPGSPQPVSGHFILPNSNLDHRVNGEASDWPMIDAALSQITELVMFRDRNYARFGRENGAIGARKIGGGFSGRWPGGHFNLDAAVWLGDRSALFFVGHRFFRYWLYGPDGKYSKVGVGLDRNEIKIGGVDMAAKVYPFKQFQEPLSRALQGWPANRRIQAAANLGDGSMLVISEGMLYRFRLPEGRSDPRDAGGFSQLPLQQMGQPRPIAGPLGPAGWPLWL